MRLTGDILDVLGSAHPDGNLLYLDRRLPAALYAQVDALLQTADGRWDKHQQAHVFPGSAWDAVMALTAHEEVITTAEARQADGWFPTSAEVVGRLLELADPQPWMRALEPSAGEGAIAIPLARLVKQVDAIEIHAGRATVLDAAAPHIGGRCANFLSQRPGWATADRYDLIVMNPPFALGQDVRHVEHALRFLRPGGRLVAVMSAGVRDRQDKAARRLRARAGQAGGWFTDLPPDAFAEAGSGIRTVVLIFPVPGGRAAGGPVRVTFDRTAEGLPVFSPAAAQPGAYVHQDNWDGGRDRVFRHTGMCIGCGVPTWRHDDDNDDVRDAFAGYTGVPIEVKDLDCAQAGTSFPRCAACSDDAKRNEKALARARAQLARGRAIQPPSMIEPIPAAGPQLTLFEVA